MLNLMTVTMKKTFFRLMGVTTHGHKEKKKPQKPSILVVSIVFYSDFMHAEDLKL